MKPIITAILALTFTISTALSSGQNDPMIMSTSIISYPTLKLTEVSGNSSVKEAKKTNKKASTKKYIKDNLQELKIEIASGEGERLNTLATFYQIKNLNSWRERLQKNYADIFSSEDIERVEREIASYNVVS